MLFLEDIHAYYGHIHALQGVSLYVGEKEIVTLIGANGAGKSTTLKTISGLLRPKQGFIRLGNENLTVYPPHKIAARGVVQVPEGRRIFGRLTVLENLEMGAFPCRNRHMLRANLQKVFHLFPRLEERSKQIAGTLSGGEQQMLAMARALMANPQILLMDEPSMGLAPVLVDSIFATIQQLNKQGTTILLVEQNARLALQVAQRGYVLQTGTVVLHAPAEDLQKNEMVRQAYLGEF